MGGAIPCGLRADSAQNMQAPLAQPTPGPWGGGWKVLGGDRGPQKKSPHMPDWPEVPYGPSWDPTG